MRINSAIKPAKRASITVYYSVTVTFLSCTCSSQRFRKKADPEIFV